MANGVNVDNNLLQWPVRELRRILEPLIEAGQDQELRRQILADLGLNPAQAGTPINIPASSLQSIHDYTKAAAADIGPEAFLQVVLDVVQVFNSVESFITAASSGTPGVVVDELVSGILNVYTLGYIRSRHPVVYTVFDMLRLIEEQSVRFGGVVEFFQDAGGFFADLYGNSWDLQTEQDAQNLSDGILFPLGVVAALLIDANVSYGWDAAPGSLSPLADGVSDRMLTLVLDGETKDAGGNTVAGSVLLSCVLLPADHQGPGVWLRLKGQGSVEVPLGSGWSVESSMSAPDVLIRFGGPSGDTALDASWSAKLSHKTKPNQRAVLGDPQGTRLEFGAFSLETKIAARDYVIVGSTKDNALFVSGSNSDGFISKLIGGGEMRADFSFGIGYSKAKGLHLEGGAGILIAIPLHKTIGPLKLQTLSIGARLGSEAKEGAIAVEASLSMAAKLGPLTASVDRIGIETILDFPGKGQQGNLGAVDMKFRFKPPNGVGLSIDGGGFRGGGFLYFEPDEARYAGVLELKFAGTISLKAIGLLTTRLPDGSDGFSLLIIINAEFTPIQLGFGFTLIGVGGLLGLNRTIKIDVLRAGIKNNALSSVLFPQNVVENAPRLISDLRMIFPPQLDHFVFGPMAKIGWGTPTLLSIELGVIVELPGPRIALLGVFKMILPDEKVALIRIQVNFLGAWEPDRQLISFDAGLYDSRIVLLPLAGDMALRIAYGSNPNFLATVGGFHPSYTPPPLALPSLSRVSINLIAGNNPRLAVEAYFAITSNTAQFGAKAELLAKAWKFSVYGFLGFDALFQFSPFYFIVEISGGLAVRAGSSVLFSIGFRLSLEGPAPWRAKGVGSFRILFVKVKVRVSKTWGQQRDTVLPDVEVLPQLLTALEHRDNWQAQLPARNQLSVTLRELDDVAADDIVAHPAGVLTVSQKTVPLSTTIDRFGSQRPQDGNRFEIQRVQSDGVEFQKVPVEEYFAPAQFHEMSSAQKLSRRSFERMPAGVKISSSDRELQSSKVVCRQVAYETLIIDRRFLIVRLAVRLVERWNLFVALLRGSAVSRSPVSLANTAEPPLSPGKVQVAQEGYAVVGVDDLVPFDGDASFESEAGAEAYRRELVQRDPALADRIQVVPNYEVQAA